MFTIILHFANGTNLTEEADVVTERPSAVVFYVGPDYTVVPHANLLYYDVIEGDDGLSEDAAVYRAPRGDRG